MSIQKAGDDKAAQQDISFPSLQVNTCLLFPSLCMIVTIFAAFLFQLTEISFSAIVW
jgi:hypothetical protein